MRPKTYLNRSNYSEGDPFLFISYRHTDSEYVYNDLEKLYDAGLQFWYDDRIEDGESWKSFVKGILTKSSCKGVIFYVSKNSIVSEAIEEEIDCFSELKKERSDFLMRIVSIGGKSMMKHLWDLSNSLSADDFERVMPQKRLIKVLSTFRSDILYNCKANPEDYSFHERLLCDLAKYGVVVSSETCMDILISKEIFVKNNGRYMFTVGQYPSVQADNVFSPAENGDFEFGGQQYRSNEYKVFQFSPIDWYLISMDDKLGYFVSKDILDLTSWNSYELWLDSFKKTAFTDTELNSVKELSLLKKDFIESNIERIPECVCTDYSKYLLKGSMPLVLTMDGADGNKRICTSNRNVILSRGIPSSAMGGVRMYMAFDFSDKLRE